MSVDVSHIIKTDFRYTGHDDAWQFILQTIDMFKTVYDLQNTTEDDWELDKEELKFRLPCDEYDFYLRNGFWVIESYDHYCQIAVHIGRYFWLRENIYDLAKVLGQDEVWYAQEFYTWNGGPLYDYNCSLEEWIDFVKRKTKHDIPEFDAEWVIFAGDEFQYEPVYHDTFKDIILFRKELEESSKQNSSLEKYTPSNIEVEKYMLKWQSLSNYVDQEAALDKLFLDTFNSNMYLCDILIKCSVLNDFYSTNIFDVHSVAKHIWDIHDLDIRLRRGDLSLVAEIADVEVGADKKKRVFYSFASKFCSHHEPSKFAIYDNYVDKVLRYFRKRDSFCDFCNEDLKDYPKFVSIVRKFQDYYGLKKYTLKQIDQYLWQLGKEYFKKEQTKKKT